MASVEIKLKLNVDLEIKAEREDIPQLTDSVKQQIAGAFAPAALIGNSQRNAKPVEQLPTPVEVSPPSAPEKSRRPRRAVRGSEKAALVEENAIDWVHDPSKWGNPAQAWSTADKCLWLLYVVGQEKGVKELNGPVITATFCKHFRQAGSVYPHIVARELGKLKLVIPPPLGEDSRIKPSQWFLTEEGIKHVENLIAQHRSQAAQTTI